MPERRDCRTVTLRGGAFAELRPVAAEDNSLAVIALEPGSGRALAVTRDVRLSDDPQAGEVAVAVVDADKDVV